MSDDRPLERAVFAQDVVVILASALGAHALRDFLSGWLPGLKPTVPTGVYVHLLLVFLPAWALCAERVGLHRVPLITGPPVSLLRAVLVTQAWGALAIALILVAAQIKLNRSLIALFVALSTLALASAKLLQRRWVERHHGRALALVIGVERGARPGEIEYLRGRRVEVLAEHTPEALRARFQKGGVDEVVISIVVPRDRVPALLGICEEVAVPVLVALERMDLGLLPPRAEMVGRTLYLAYHRHEPDRPSLLVKAALDRLGAAVGILVGWPVMLVAAGLVKLGSRGPALFVQQRGGLNGRPFPMLKFRTMRAGAEAEREALLSLNQMDGPVFKIAEDPRVTPIGRWLRRTSLDELPQLFNVLVGHMSLVGPRPLPLVETLDLTGADRRRLSMKPGLTCLWQVSGRNELGFRAWMTLDLEYVDNWSLGLDLAILLRTVPVLLSRRGAS